MLNYLWFYWLVAVKWLHYSFLVAALVQYYSAWIASSG